MNNPTGRDFRVNFMAHMGDGAFFGMALGFASFITIIPLFMSRLTGSAILIGLIPAIHSVGWQLPQLFIAQRVSRLKRFIPMVLSMTIHERLPFLGMAVVAWFLPSIGKQVALILTFVMLIWQGLGGGLTATPWQSMIGKIIPSDNRGFFFGFQAALANLFASGSAVLAGFILARYDTPLDFTLCFLLACGGLVISYIFLSFTRERESVLEEVEKAKDHTWKKMGEILRRDGNFRWYLVVRMLSQLAVMAFSFYTIYALRYHQMSEEISGLMMGVFTIGQIAANPIMGRIGDRWSHPAVMKVGALCASASALLAWLAPNLNWFYLVFLLAGLANVAIWTIGLAIILEFGEETERPVYIGLANTLIAPVTILAPILGGWLADSVGFQATFLVSCVSGLAAAAVLHILLHDPRHLRQAILEEESLEV
jgi:MFS family permease